MTKLKLEVGKKYRRRDGKKTVEVEYSPGNPVYPFGDIDSYILYTSEGRLFEDQENPYDLIEEVFSQAELVDQTIDKLVADIRAEIEKARQDIFRGESALAGLELLRERLRANS